MLDIYSGMRYADEVNSTRILEAYRLAQATPMPSARLADVVRPFSEYLASLPVLGNRLVWRRDEPVLRMGLTMYTDEREYEAMEQSELAVSTPAGALVQRLLSDGWTIEKKEESTSADADTYRDFARAAFARIEDFETVLDKMARTRNFGWYPVQVLYDTFQWQGKVRRGVRRLIDHKHHYFTFTMDAAQDLVFLGDQMQPPQIYETEGDRRAWLTFRAGSTYSPFGKALYAQCWFMWDALRRLTAIYELGQHNALLGTPIFSREARGGASDFVKTDGSSPSQDVNLLTAALVTQIREVLRIRKEIGAIVLGPGMKLEDLKSIETIDGCLRAMQDYRTMLQIAIQGEQLSSTVANTGAYSLGQVHEATGEGYAKRAGRIAAAGLTKLIRRLVDMNFPGPVDESDYPVFRFNLETRINIEELKAYVDMGGEVDEVPIARQFKIPLPAGYEGGSLKRQDPNALPGAMLASLGLKKPGDSPKPGDKPSEPPAASQPPKVPPTRARSADLPAGVEADAEDVEQMADSLVAAEGSRVASAVSTYIRAMRDAVLDAAGDADVPKV